MAIRFPELTEEERRKRLNVPAGRIRLVIDTDAKNEVDDQFAISWALRSPERFQLEAVYAAPFSGHCWKNFVPETSDSAEDADAVKSPADGMEASYEEIKKLFHLLNEDGTGRIFRGSTAYLQDTFAPVESEAVRDLIRRAMGSEELLYVAAIGTPTNIASALLMEPELVKRIVGIWLGGEPLYFSHGIEFNLMEDVRASQILFDSGVPMVCIPCMNVASLLAVTEPELKTALLNKSKIGTYLAQIVLETFQDPKEAILEASFQRHVYLKGREDREDEYLDRFVSSHVAWSRIIWDISTIAFLKNPGWTPSTLELAPILLDDLSWDMAKKQEHSIRVVNYCHRNLIVGDMFACLGYD